MRRLLILLAATALVVAGCGGGGGSTSSKPLTKAEYQAKLEQIAKDIGSKITVSNSKKPTKKDLEAVKTALNSFADELDKVTPPKEVTEVHTHLVSAMRKLGNDLPGIFEKLDKAKDASAAIAALFGAPAIQNLLKVQQEFKAKGYDLNLNG